MTHHHPNVHAEAKQWSEDQTLHVVACYSNPYRWQTRRKLANDFRRHMAQSPNVVLHMVELAYGDRPFEVTSSDDPNDVQLRTKHELFHKENLLSIGVSRCPPTMRYGAIVDADWHFVRHDWALETIHQLQHHEWVQMFSSYTDMSGESLGTGHRPIGQNNGFVFNYVQNGYQVAEHPAGFVDSSAYGGRRVGATGGAWAFTRDAWNTTGGLLDRCILGHGDWFMAFGLVGQRAPDLRIANYTAAYRDYIHAWQDRAAGCNRNVGYVDGHAMHGFHGPKTKRGYSSRDAILVGHAYDPGRDVHPDWQGVLQLHPAKHKLRDDVRRYFLSRSEDLPNT